MGLSKKKFRAKIKEQPRITDYMESAAEKKKNSDAKKLAADLAGAKDALFTENTGKGDLKKKREALRADRFKKEARVNPSKTEQFLIKRILQKEQNREAAGIELPVKKSKRSK